MRIICPRATLPRATSLAYRPMFLYRAFLCSRINVASIAMKNGCVLLYASHVNSHRKKYRLPGTDCNWFTANKSARSFVKMPPYWDKIILVVRDCVYSSWQSSSDSHFEMVDVPFLLFSALAVFLNIAPLCWQIEHNNSGPVCLGFWVIVSNLNFLVSSLSRLSGALH